MVVRLRCSAIGPSSALERGRDLAELALGRDLGVAGRRRRDDEAPADAPGEPDGAAEPDADGDALGDGLALGLGDGLALAAGLADAPGTRAGAR